MSSSEDAASELDLAASRALEIVERALLDGKTENIPDETVQRLLTAGTKLFANKVEMEDRFFALHGSGGRDRNRRRHDLLGHARAVNLSTFDLAMWFQRPRSNEE